MRTSNRRLPGENEAGSAAEFKSTMTAAELQDLDFDTEAERVLLWREESSSAQGTTGTRLANWRGLPGSTCTSPPSSCAAAVPKGQLSRSCSSSR